MAAGRKGVVLRRRESYRESSVKELDHCRNGSAQNGFHVGKEEEREEGELCVEPGVCDYERASGFQAVDGDEVLPPPEKRRKFSPIVWDLPEKKGVIPSEKGVTEVTTVSPSCPTLLTSPVDDGVLREGVSRMSPQNSSCVLQSKNDDQEADGENNAQGWNIKMSRWASDGQSPVGAVDDGQSPVGAVDEFNSGKLKSSPEIGEFQRECSESTITRSSGSNGLDNSGGRFDDSDSEKEFSTDSMVDAEERSDVGDYASDSDEDAGLMNTHRNINMLQSCRSVCEFEMIKKINEGTYGVVYKARDKKTGEILALKKVKMNIERDGFPLSSLREINILLSFDHPSIVDVKEIVVDNYDGTFMVMEYMEHDLKGLMEAKKQPFSMGEIKYLMLQLLEGVKYLHDNWVLHRDLKTSNILLNDKGELKICDFGLSRQFGSPLKPYTPLVVTLWYRAPELLLGAKEYSTAIDMWSVGCIMAELVAKEPLFTGRTELEQIDKIFRTLGTPDEKIWPGLSKLPGPKAKFVKQPYNMLRKKFPATSFTGSPVLSELGFDLLKKLLTYNPEERISAEEALLHDWFHEVPLPKYDFKPIFPSLRG